MSFKNNSLYRDRDLFTITAIRKAIAKVKEEHNIDITEDEAFEMVVFQSIAIRKAMENKQVVKLDYIGKFLIKEGREEEINLSIKANELGLKGNDRIEYLKQQRHDLKTLKRNDGQHDVIRDSTPTDNSLNNN